jgi:glucose-6-phosphate dehydrogenase assembly protein OpcA
VYVWWTEGLPEDKGLFLQLLENADRLVADSEQFHHLPEDMLALSELVQQKESTGVGDLSWTRLLLWREILGRQRSIAEMRHHLSSVKSVELRHAKGRGRSGSVPALLFLAWLADLLGWDTSGVSAHGRSRLTLRAGERSVSAYLHGVDYPEIEPGQLVGVKIACQSETARAMLSISRTGDPYHLTIRTEHRGGASEDSVRSEPLDASDLLMRELDASPHDAEYGRVLRAAVPLIMAIRA